MEQNFRKEQRIEQGSIDPQQAEADIQAIRDRSDEQRAPQLEVTFEEDGVLKHVTFGSLVKETRWHDAEGSIQHRFEAITPEDRAEMDFVFGIIDTLEQEFAVEPEVYESLDDLFPREGCGQEGPELER